MKKSILLKMIFIPYIILNTLTTKGYAQGDYATDPHLTPAVKAFLKPLNSGGAPLESLPVADARNVLVGAQNAFKVDLSGIEESEKEITADGYKIKLNIVRPAGAKGKLPVFMFIHGGGWVLGDYPTHKRMVRDLSVLTGYVGVFVNYSLAPEHKYPQPVNEVYAAAKWISANGSEINVDGSKLGIVGNSAGGNLATASALMAKEKGTPLYKVQILFWPVTDANFETESYKLYGKQRFLTDSLIQVAENDILRDEGEAYGRKLSDAGVVVTTVRYNDVIHDFGLLNGLAEIPQTKALFIQAAAELKKYLK